jgi:Ca2+-binding EF-hand superfamily protein
MSISGIGTGNASQLLAAMLSQLDSATSATSSANTGTSSTSSTVVSSTDSDTALTGSGKGNLSDQILGLLMMMKNDPSMSQTATNSNSTSTSSTSISATSLSDPLSNLISAIDTDGDGSISKSEMESYIESKGGTQSQTDALFSALDQNGSGSLTKAQLASDLQNAAPGGAQGARGHHHHHHHGSVASANDVASKLVQAMDTDADGSVSQSEFENLVTSLGGTTSEADADFAALDTQNGGSVTAS